MPIEQPLRVPRVLAQHDVRLGELAEHAQRDVVEVPDRGGADRRAARNLPLPSTPRTRGAPLRQARLRSQLGAHDPEPLTRGSQGLPARHLERRREEELRRRLAEPPADDHERPGRRRSRTSRSPLPAGARSRPAPPPPRLALLARARRAARRSSPSPHSPRPHGPPRFPTQPLRDGRVRCRCPGTAARPRRRRRVPALPSPRKSCHRG